MVRVAQCWDDGAYNDIRLTELLRKYNAKATFNLNPGLMPSESTSPHWGTLDEPGWNHKGYFSGKVGLNDLTTVYDGFQVASHGWVHKVASWVPDDEFFKDTLDARHYLEDAFQRECRGYAWPCGVQTPFYCEKLQQEGFLYGRTTVHKYGAASFENPLALNPSCHFQSERFLEAYKKAKEDNGVFYFWGHSYELLDYDRLWLQFEERLKFIADDPETVWINVADIVG